MKRTATGALSQRFSAVIFGRAGQGPGSAHECDRSGCAVDQGGREAVQGLRASAQESNDLPGAIVRLGKELAAAHSAVDAPSVQVAVEGAVRDLHPLFAMRYFGWPPKRCATYSNIRTLRRLRWSFATMCVSFGYGCVTMGGHRSADPRRRRPGRTFWAARHARTGKARWR